MIKINETVLTELCLEDDLKVIEIARKTLHNGMLKTNNLEIFAKCKLCGELELKKNMVKVVYPKSGIYFYHTECYKKRRDWYSAHSPHKDVIYPRGYTGYLN